LVRPCTLRILWDARKTFVPVHAQFQGTHAKGRPCAQTITRNTENGASTCTYNIHGRTKIVSMCTHNFEGRRQNRISLCKQNFQVHTQNGMSVHAQFPGTQAKNGVNILAQFSRTHVKMASQSTHIFQTRKRCVPLHPISKDAHKIRVPCKRKISRDARKIRRPSARTIFGSHGKWCVPVHEKFSEAHEVWCVPGHANFPGTHKIVNHYARTVSRVAPKIVRPSSRKFSTDECNMLRRCSLTISRNTQYCASLGMHNFHGRTQNCVSLCNDNF
jgi:hypothetical protein